MFKTQGLILMAVFTAVLFSGCDSGNSNSASESALRTATSFELNVERTAWLRNHLPNETVAYFNMPTPWNYLFDAKADAMHVIQQLPAHIEQVEKIKQGVKDNYYQYIPAAYHDLTSLLVEHMATSLEVAVINNAPGAFLPTVAVGSRLQNLSHAELIKQLNTLLKNIDPSMELEAIENSPMWSFKVNQFLTYLQYNEDNGQMLIYGGMGANQQKMTELWSQKSGDELAKIHDMSQQADPSGLNMKMWIAASKMYQMGKAFVPPEQQQLITSMGLDQMDYIWLGFESNKGQSALALHVMMPETGWRLMLPRAADWFDVTLAGKPRSVMQFSLPTADQVKTAIEVLELDAKFSDKDKRDLAEFKEIGEELGFDFYDILDAYYQQVIWVKDESGSWFAMKIKDNELRARIEKSFADYFKINSSRKKLDGIDIMQAHFSIYQKLYDLNEDLPADAEKYREIMGIFKEHVYWYEENDVIFMSQVPQVLALKKQHNNQISLADWLSQNQGGDWNSAIFAYGKDIKHMPQDLYHYYLLLLQGFGDLAQVEVDLFALPTAKQLNLPESGRINLTLSSDAEIVSFKFGYEYSMLEPILSAEGGFATIAVVSILAAYAIPAYRDYTVRAKIGSQLAMASALKVVVAERLLVDGTITEDTFQGIEDEFSIEGLSYYIDAETGTIVIDLEGVDSAFEAGDDIYLEPSDDVEGVIEWFCLSNIREAYLPADCRF